MRKRERAPQANAAKSTCAASCLQEQPGLGDPADDELAVVRRSSHFAAHFACTPVSHGADNSPLPASPSWPFMQAKLAIGRVDDPLEYEADRIADRVMRESPSPQSPVSVPPVVSRKHAVFEKERWDGVKDVAEAQSTIDQVLRTPGQPLEPGVRTFFEPRFGHDLSEVRVHSDERAALTAKSVAAEAYTVGQHVVFAPGRYRPTSVEGGRLLAHELVHTVQQRGSQAPAGNQTVRREVPDAGPEPLPGGVRDPDPARPVADLADSELGAELQKATEAGDSARVEALEDEMDRRSAGWGTASPRGPAPVTSGSGAITPDVALQLLDNMAEGKAPFKPQEGLGGSSWFTTEGNPYTSVSADKSINVQVEIAKGSNPLTFREADLIKIRDAEAGPTRVKAEAEYRAKFNIPEAVALSKRALKNIERVLSRFTEKQMWKRIGEQVAASQQKVGEVILEPGSQFSDAPGKFAVVADASKIGLKGGTAPIVDALAKQGVGAEPVVIEAAEKLASKLKWAGRVRTAFRYGGRILIVVAVTADLIKIYRAKDHMKAFLTSVGGWAGATAAGAAFAAWWTPADVAGPWAWAAHGVGTLLAGGVGYWVGSNTTRYIYELVVDPVAGATQ